MNMFKTPAEYATMLLNCFTDSEDALIEVFEGPKQYPQVPNRFWRDVYGELVRQAVARDTAPTETKTHGFNTGRLYQADGQRISFVMHAEDVLFNDHSRGISGRIEIDNDLDRLRPHAWIMRHYDNGRYCWDHRADAVKAATWQNVRV